MIPVMSTAADIRVEPMLAADWPAVRRIYAEGIATGLATLERETPDWDHFARSHRADGRLVARRVSDDQVVGWVALTSYSSRRVYAGVTWESVYVAADARGQGIGRTLLEHLIVAADAAGIWTLCAGVLSDNTASLALHERVGFRRVGTQERLGRDPSGRWRDVVLMERRRRDDEEAPA